MICIYIHRSVGEPVSTANSPSQVTQAIPDNRNQLKFSFEIMNPIPCCLTLTWNWQLTMTNNAGNWIKYWIDEILKRMKETVLLTLSLSFLTFESSWWSICKTNNDDFPLFYIHSFLHSLMNPIYFDQFHFIFYFSWHIIYEDLFY